MKLIVGLGNPGRKHEQTRHSVGFMTVDKLLEVVSGELAVKSKFKFEKRFNTEICELATDNGKLILVKPQTFMNQSGIAVKKITKSYQLSAKSLYIVHDDLDLPLGNYKIQFSKGPREHNGVKSVEQHLKTKGFWRVRVGIGGENYQRIKLRGGSMAEDYVLKPFTKEEREIINNTIDKIVRRFVKFEI